MLKLSICIEMFWRTLPPEERIKQVKKNGYPAFEFWDWQDKDINRLRAAKEETGLEVAAFCLQPNDLLVERNQEEAIADGLVASSAVARSLDCNRLIVTTGNVLPDETFESTRRRVVRKLKNLSKIAEDQGIILLLEPLNPLVDHKGYWLTRMAEAADIVQEVSSPNLKILDDLYHQQITEGNLIANLTTYAPLIGHFHSAGVPGRHELEGGELDYRRIFAAINRTGYNGYVGLEFSPTVDEETALRQPLTLI